MRTSRLTFALVMTLAFLFSNTGNVNVRAAMGPPHDTMGCLSCHDMNAWDQPMMIPNDPPYVPANQDDSLFNSICQGCHNGTDAIDAHMHSSLTTSTKYGTWTIGCSVCHNQHRQDQVGSTVGLNGAFIRNSIDLNKIGKSGYKNVKLLSRTGAKSFADGDTVYDGICEVCHTQTKYFRNDGGAPDQNHSGKNLEDCTTACHNADTGFQGAPPHTFIVNDNETGKPANVCSGCHTGFDTEPETAHSECTVCHINAPDLFNNTFATYNGQADDDGNSMFANLGNTPVGAYGNVGTGRITDPDGTLIDGTGGDLTFNPIKCGYCHKAKPDALASANHGGHLAGHFGWGAGGCEDCHGAGAATEEVVKTIHANNCDLCHTGGTYDATSNGIGAAAAAANGADGDAALAEGAAAAGTPFDPAVYTCTTCHAIAGSVNAASLGGIHHDNKGGSTCLTSCHTVAGHQGDHTARVSNTASCTSCHPGVIGSASGAPVDPLNGAKHDACTTCHQFAAGTAKNGILVAAPGGSKGVTTLNPQTAATNDGGGACATCHTTTWLSMHQSAPGVIHGAPNNFVTALASCATANCHDANGGTTARASSATPFVAGGDVHAALGCTSCHNADGSRKTSGFTGKVDQNPAGGGACGACHTSTSTWTTIHSDNTANIDHSAEVANQVSCNHAAIPCHDATGSKTTGQLLSLINATANNIHDTCASCHNADGSINSGKAVPGGNMNTAGGACAACHSTWTFGNHVHHTSYNQVSFNSTIDRSQESNSPTTACDQCHTPVGALSTWTGVLNEHSANCNVCHSFSQGAETTGDPGTPVQATVFNTIATDGTANCTTCHVPKLWSTGASSTHGGHQYGQFGWTGGCENCHGAGAATEDVVSTIHGGNCNMCHTGGVYNAATNGAGPSANGIDGDAGLAEGDAGTWAATCTTCHAIAGSVNAASLGGIHHDNKTDGVVTGVPATNCTTSCHAVSGHEGNHTARVASTADCTTACHTGTTGGASGAPVLDSDNKIHDYCTTCHQIAAQPAVNGALVAAPGGSKGVSTMNPGTAATNDGGGACITCHAGGTWTTMHTPRANAIHAATLVTNTASCTTSCHSIASTSPFTGGSDVHSTNVCATCHTGANNGGLISPNAKAAGLSASGGQCSTCHNLTWTNTHGDSAKVDHSQEVVNQASCNDATVTCHDTTGNKTLPNDLISVANNNEHDACTSCHNADGSINTGAVVPGGTMSVTGGTCDQCHTTWTFANHVHHTSYNNTTYEINGIDGLAGTKGDNDTSQTNPTPEVGCANCHNDSSGALANFMADIFVEHKSNCANCHSYAGGKSEDPVVVKNTIAAGAATSCDTCHEDKTPDVDHGGHDNSHFGWGAGGCEACHGAGAATEPVVSVIHGNGCSYCHTGGVNNATTNGAGPAANGIDGDATLAEGAAIAGTPFNPAVYTCTTCHVIGGGSVNAASLGGIHHDNKTDGVVTGVPATNCTTSCHAVSGHEGNHTARVASTADCTTACHTGTTGGASGAPVLDSDNKIHDYCTTCHQITAQPAVNGALVAAPGGSKGVSTMNPGTAATNDGGGACITCHAGGTWTTMHTPRANAIHASTLVTNTASCTTSCHSIASTSPFTGGSDVHSTNVCATCHTGANNGGLISPNAKAAGLSASGGQCSTCHNLTWTNTHGDSAKVDHSQEVVNQASCNHATIPCHDATGDHGLGNITSLVNAAANNIHDACTSCHNADGSINTGAVVPNGTMNATGGACAVCHNTMTFGSHVHHTSYNQVAYVPATDRSQEDDTATGECAACHTPVGALTTWTGVLNEHSANCNVCHSFTQGAETTGDPGTPVEADVITRIATDAATSCVSCHVKKEHSAAGGTSIHGQHRDTDFGWSGGCQACHGAGAATEAVVATIHGGTCSMCHTSTPYNATTNGAGPSANGIDGDAGLAEGDAGTWTATCTTCHAISGAVNAASVGGIHHDNKTDGVVTGVPATNCTTSCHAVSGHEGNHTARVASTADCTTACHTGTTGGANGAPVLDSDNKIHDYCTTCHQITAQPAVNGALVAPPGGSKGVSTMNPGTAATNDGGGACITCHAGGTWTTMHTPRANAIHAATLVTNTASCTTSCHSIASTSPFTGGSDVHSTNVCATCHTGANNGGLISPNAKAAGLSASGGQCSTCHNLTWTNTHGDSAKVDHSQEVVNQASCNHATIPCHDATGDHGLGNITSLVNAAANNIHDACSSCHNADGSINTGAVVPNGTMNATGGACAVCHNTMTFGSHVHHTSYNQVSYNSTVDRSQLQNLATTACDQCHTPVGALTTWTGVLNEHSANCNTCHDFTVDATGDPGTPVVATVTNVIATDATANCTTCHVPKLWSNATSEHGGHADGDFGWGAGGCEDCHGAGAATESVVNTIHNKTCDMCHTGGVYDATTDGIGAAAAAANGADGDANLANGAAAAGTPFNPAVYTCTTCHQIAGSVDAASMGGIHHDNKGSVIDCTTNCHTVSGHEGNHVNMIADSVGDCTTCHTGTKAVSGGAGGPVTVLDTWANVVNGAASPVSGTFNTTYVSENNRMVIVAVGATNGGTALSFTVTYGGEPVTQFALNTGNGTSTSWMGYIDQNGLAAKSGSTVNVTVTGTGVSGIHVHAISLYNALQSAPTNTQSLWDANKSTVLPTLTYSADDMVLILGNKADNGITSTAATDGFTVSTAIQNINAMSTVTGYMAAATGGSTTVATECSSSGGAAPGLMMGAAVSAAPGGGTGAAPIDGGDGMVHDTCTDCHEFAAGPGMNGVLVTAPGVRGVTTMNPQTAATTDGGGDCSNCHTATFASMHGTAPGVNHSTQVATQATCNHATVPCHDATGDQIVPNNLVNAVANNIHDACTSCHEANGPINMIASPPGSSGMNATGGACAVCHDTFAFTNHVHHTSYNQVSFNSTIDRSQESNSPATACDQCHTPVGALSTWTGVLNEHSADCNVCHSFTQGAETTGDPGTPVEATVITRIATDGTTNCTSCHVPKLWSTGASSTHGGHSDTDFGWAGGCQDCHGAGAATESVVATIHGGTCDMCHTGGTYNAGTNGAGPVANGIDGDAGLAEGDAGTWAATCTTCHAISGSVNAASIGGIHHDNKGGSTCTTSCHTVAGHQGDHTARISSTASCTGCHPGVIGGPSGAPIDGADGAKHDTCTTCHQFATTPAMNGILVTAPGGSKGVTTLNPQTAATNDGGGACATCHTTTWTSMHQSAPGVIHGAPNNFVTALASCATANCHDANGGATARATSATPFIAGGDVHAALGCASCHNADGTRKTTGFTGKVDQNPALGGNCGTCHTSTSTWTTIHSDNTANIDHSAEVANQASCNHATIPCHDATGSHATGAILSLINGTANNIHDTCASCHNTDGSINTGKAVTGGGSVNASGGNCAACHTQVFTGHLHHTSYNQVAYDSAIDRSQELNSSTTACAVCHVPSGGLSTWTGVYNEHSANCDVCHNFSVDATGAAGTPVAATVTTVIATDATAKCTTCHVKKLWSSGATSTHGGHATTDFQWTATAGSKTSCGASVNGALCHDDSTATNVITTVHNGTWASGYGNACQNCHTSSSGGDGTSRVGLNGDGSAAVPSPASATTHTEVCTTCHTIAKATIHHNNAKAVAGNCHLCHADPRNNGTGAENVAYQQMPCRECHIKTFGAGIEIADIVLQGGNLGGGTGTLAGNLKQTIAAANHQFPNTTAITNYGACFSCHGQTGKNAKYPASTKILVSPFHALPTASYNQANLGTSNVLDTNLHGGGAWQMTGATYGYAASEFQGNTPTGFTTMWNTSYFPMGKSVLNLGWAMLSHTKKAANNTTSKENNAGLITNAIYNTPAGMNFGTATPPHIGSIKQFPHFDATPGTLGVDNITGCSATASYVCGVGATGPCGGARSITVSANSSDNTSTLYVVYGGKVVYTGADPMTNVNINIQALATAGLGDNHMYASGGPGIIFVVSNKGGSCKIKPTGTLGQGMN